MRKLTLMALAASAAFLPSVVSAQPAGHARPGASAGHSFRHVGPNVTVRRGGGHFRHPGPGFRHHRLQRGFFVHPFWFGPQFHVQNWQLYGFAEPPRDQRWIRYYDDAYLIDREGRVRDTRYGLDWDEYGERWESDEGIPHYYGRGDWRPGDEDYAWVEGHGAEGWDYGAYGLQAGPAYGYGPGYAYPAPAPACHPAPPSPCGGYGYYGYGYVYPIIIETTVTTAPTYVEEVVEEVVQVRQPPRRRYRPPPRPRPRPSAPAPRPPAGERG